MDCSEAQSLIRAGAIPGAGSGRVPQLGFHLAGCPKCRAFLHADTFRSSSGQSLAARMPIFSMRHLFRPPSMATLILVLLAVMAGWYVGLPLARAWGDVGTMTSLRSSARPGFSSTPPEPTTPPIRASEDIDPQVYQASSVGAAATPRREQGQAYVAKAGEAAPVNSVAKAALIIEGNTHTLSAATGRSPSEPAVLQGRVDDQPPAPAGDAGHLTAGTTPTAPAPATGAVTILVLGLDARKDEGPLARSDAIMVMRLDLDTQKVALLSLPRDLWVPIPNYGEGKIDTAYFLGELTGEGAAVATLTVSQALGIQIDRTAVLNFNGFRSLIDSLGGITIDVPTELHDPYFPTDDYGSMAVHFEPGPQMMDGEQALIYSRIRHPDSDFERMRRQQSVVLAIAQKIRARGVLRNLHDADRLTRALRPFVRTDLPRAMALNLLWSMRSADLDEVKRITVETSMLGETTIDGAYALVADPSVLQSLGAQLVAEK